MGMLLAASGHVSTQPAHSSGSQTVSGLLGGETIEFVYVTCLNSRWVVTVPSLHTTAESIPVVVTGGYIASAVETAGVMGVAQTACGII